MSSPELVASRLEELLAGAFPETEGEAGLQGLARELRSASVAAPSSLRDRIAEIGAPAQPRLRRPRRRLLAACAAAILVIGTGVLGALRFGLADEATNSAGSRLSPALHLERSEPPALRGNLLDKNPPPVYGSAEATPPATSTSVFTELSPLTAVATPEPAA